MLTAALVLKRLEALEKRSEGRPRIKVFIHYAERNPPFWKPEDPETWQQSHPRGKAVLLMVCNCRRQGV